MQDGRSDEGNQRRNNNLLEKKLSGEIDFNHIIYNAGKRENGINKTDELIKAFTKSYFENSDKISVEEWLFKELKNYIPEQDTKEIEKITLEIIDSVKITENMKESQSRAIAMGRSRESWLSSKILESTSQMSAREQSKYLQELDEAVKKSNDAMRDAITTKSGIVNQNPNLDGFIAEQHHANSFNMNAKATGSDMYAEVLKPKSGQTYQKNSVDIVIKDHTGKIVSRYQVKYGATAEDTIKMIKHGDYRGQQLIVPEDQIDAVRKAFPDRKVSSTISNGKTSSKTLTKEEAKKLQEKAQKDHFMELDWNDFKAKDIAIGIARQAGTACLQGAAMGAVTSVASQLWQEGKVQPLEVAESALMSGADFGVKTAVAGALKVATEKEFIKILPKGTPAATYANIAFVAVENIKIMIKVAKGELTAKEGIERMQQATCSCIASIICAIKGAEVGAAICTVLGPVGIAVGSFVGGVVGGIAGSAVGQAVAKGAQMIRDTAVEVVKSVGSFVGDVVSGISDFVCGLFDW